MNDPFYSSATLPLNYLFVRHADAIPDEMKLYPVAL